MLQVSSLEPHCQLFEWLNVLKVLGGMRDINKTSAFTFRHST